MLFGYWVETLNNRAETDAKLERESSEKSALKKIVNELNVHTGDIHRQLSGTNDAKTELEQRIAELEKELVNSR